MPFNESRRKLELDVNEKPVFSKESRDVVA